MRLALNLVSVHRAQTGKASAWPTFGLSAVWENAVVSASSSSSWGSGLGQELPLPLSQPTPDPKGSQPSRCLPTALCAHKVPLFLACQQGTELYLKGT